MSDSTRKCALQELNWVDARAECSVAEMFKSLELGVQEDVERRVSLAKARRADNVLCR